MEWRGEKKGALFLVSAETVNTLLGPLWHMQAPFSWLCIQSEFIYKSDLRRPGQLHHISFPSFSLFTSSRAPV